MSCCPETLALLADLGCTHAARMHARGAAADPNAWSADDWRAHMREEDQILFPLFERLGPTAAVVVAQLRADHVMFERELQAYGVIASRIRMLEHSRTEDALTRRLLTSGVRFSRSGVR